MYLHKATYDPDELFSANYHIHTNLSRCGKKEMTLDAILKTDIKVYLGAELSAHGEKKYTLRYSDSRLEYHLYAHNHYHMFGWEQPEDTSPEGYKEHCKKSLYNIINSGKADCLAHPFIDKYIVREFKEEYGFTYGCITNLWTDNEIGDIMEAGKKAGAAWEINTTALIPYKEFMIRYFHIGKEVGVCFNLGTDAHVLKNIDPSPLKEFFIKEIMRG